MAWFGSGPRDHLGAQIPSNLQAGLGCLQRWGNLGPVPHCLLNNESLLTPNLNFPSFSLVLLLFAGIRKLHSFIKIPCKHSKATLCLC